MRAVLLEDATPRRLRMVDDWPEPEPGPGEVLVAVSGVGVCGSDLALLAAKRHPPGFPWLVGHETSGEVIGTGDGVDQDRVGQRVVIEPNFPCLACPACASGRTSSCPYRRSLGFTEPGTLAERIAVPARFAWPLPAIWDEGDAVCAEPLIVARAAIRRASSVRPIGEGGCLVVGAGSQGVLLCLSLAGRGIIPAVLEPRPGRRDLAVQFGARPLLPNDGGFSLVFETSGTGAGLDEAISRAAPNALIMLIGQNAQPVPLVTQIVVQRQLTLTGSLIYDHPRDFAEGIADGKPGAEQMLKACYPMEEAEEAFRAAAEIPGKTWIKVGSGG
jgi:threonine dehydrogenase-like Zn-dependent dehydrogenase